MRAAARRGHAGPGRLPERGHVCMVVRDDSDYRDTAAAFLAGGAALREKTVAFGPEGSRLQGDLGRLADVVADPHVAFLGRRGLEPETMLTMFREQAAVAAAEGFAGLRVAADMDWLLPAAPAAEDVIGFEVMLDRTVAELGASVLCAYRRGSFDHGTVLGTLCIHPACLGHDAEPPFKLVWGDDEGWVLTGAVDLGAADQLAGALKATVATPWRVDVTGLDFIDVAGMRAVADAAATARVPLELRGAHASVRRHWGLAGFDRVAPSVRFTG